MKSSKNQNDTARGVIVTIVFAAAIYFYTGFIWALIIGGFIIVIGSVFFLDSFWQKITTIAIGLAICGLGLLLTRLLNKNIFDTLPAISF